MREIPAELINRFIDSVREEVQSNGSTTVWSVPAYREECEELGIEFEDLLTASIREQTRRSLEEDNLACEHAFDPDEEIWKTVAMGLMTHIRCELNRHPNRYLLGTE